MDLRPAKLTDLPDLIALEQETFASDRLTRRQFRRLIRQANGRCLVAQDGGGVAGYGIVLFRTGTSLARLYSLAVSPRRSGGGIGRRLLAELESAAVAAGCLHMRLEVRPDNTRAQRFYREAGYHPFGRYLEFYQDKSEALRFQKRLAPAGRSACRLPFYAQTTDFTCGPAALLMALAGLAPSIVPSRRLELQLWREATTIFMTAGHGGCGPYGLALAAHRRGLRPSLYVSTDGPLFLDGVRDPRKREVLRLVQGEFRAEAAEAGFPVQLSPLDGAGLARELDAGAVVLVLVSMYRLYGAKSPHWVVAHHRDERWIYVHDPYPGKGQLDRVPFQADLPIPHAEFDRMARYGRARHRAAIVLRAAEPA